MTKLVLLLLALIALAIIPVEANLNDIQGSELNSVVSDSEEVPEIEEDFAQVGSGMIEDDNCGKNDAKCKKSVDECDEKCRKVSQKHKGRISDRRLDLHLSRCLERCCPGGACFKSVSKCDERCHKRAADMKEKKHLGGSKIDQWMAQCLANCKKQRPKEPVKISKCPECPRCPTPHCPRPRCPRPACPACPAAPPCICQPSTSEPSMPHIQAPRCPTPKCPECPRPKCHCPRCPQPRRPRCPRPRRVACGKPVVVCPKCPDLICPTVECPRLPEIPAPRCPIIKLPATFKDAPKFTCTPCNCDKKQTVVKDEVGDSDSQNIWSFGPAVAHDVTVVTHDEHEEHSGHPCHDRCRARSHRIEWNHDEREAWYQKCVHQCSCKLPCHDMCKNLVLPTTSMTEKVRKYCIKRCESHQKRKCQGKEEKPDCPAEKTVKLSPEDLKAAELMDVFNE